MRPLGLQLAGADFDRLVVQIVGHGDDGLGVDVELVVGGFHGRFPCTCQDADFARLLAGLERLDAGGSGPAEFATSEGQLGFVLREAGRGRIECRGHAVDRCGDGNRLDWCIMLDPVGFPPLLVALRDIVAALGRR